jgi:hypothetical protein
MPSRVYHLSSGRSGGGCLKKEPTFTGRLSELNSHNYENSKKNFADSLIKKYYEKNVSLPTPPLGEAG